MLARNRWHLAYTLVRNPELRFYRYHFVRRQRQLAARDLEAAKVPEMAGVDYMVVLSGRFCLSCPPPSFPSPPRPSPFTRGH